MATQKSYIPPQILKFSIFEINFMLIVVANAVAWGIPAGMVTSLQAFQTAFQAAWAVSQVKQSRTPTDTQNTLFAKNDYIAAIRSFTLSWLKYNVLVTDEFKKELGLTIDDVIRTKINPPDFSPIISAKLIQAGVLKMGGHVPPHYTLGSRRSLPYNVTKMEFKVKFGGSAPTTEFDFPITELFTRVNKVITVDPVQVRGTIIYLMGRYLTPNVQPGPWSAVFTMYVP